MDFIDVLCDKINEIPELSSQCKLGYLGTGESLVLYPLPGGRTVQEYMDGTKDQQLLFEIAMKSTSHSKIHHTLWTVQTELEKLKELSSLDDSFEFEELIITNKPFINNADEQGFFTFLLNVQANITVFREE